MSAPTAQQSYLIEMRHMLDLSEALRVKLTDQRDAALGLLAEVLAADDAAMRDLELIGIAPDESMLTLTSKIRTFLSQRIKSPGVREFVSPSPDLIGGAVK